MRELSKEHGRGVGADPSVAAFAPEDFPVVVHSHLRWSFVWQRPQQIHSRLARRHRVLFVEEPAPGTGAPRLEISEPWPNVVVAQPVLPETSGDDTATAERERAVVSLLRNQRPAGFDRAVHWFYSPQLTPQLDAFGDPLAVVYDCMDELTQFAFAPRQLAEREKELLTIADVVFTGGYELFRAKSRLHDNVHFFGCGVDFDHFHRAAGEIEVAADLRAIPAPRLGYVGVIDERLDYPLIESLARENPDWSLAFVGPVAKVDAASLPRAQNLHYLGARDYADLPSYLAGFQVCLMPFAMNDASRFINPTKTLEYLASARPVLSTPVRDVVRNFGDAVHISDRSQFMARAKEILAGGAIDPERGCQVARRSSWEQTVEKMESLVRAAAPAAADGLESETVSA
ncbi:MAG TPA: glycosyltransferase [Thermoanaerobaculia bacterium]|jgi:glycosyltransferase involved in cell wall biosynthesis|nr:glycosyltransferase [Thermoanaerobaculia bacterium]